MRRAYQAACMLFDPTGKHLLWLAASLQSSAEEDGTQHDARPASTADLWRRGRWGRRAPGRGLPKAGGLALVPTRGARGAPLLNLNTA